MTIPKLPLIFILLSVYPSAFGSVSTPLPSARHMRQAWDALKLEKFDRAKSEAKLTQKDSLLSNLGTATEALAELGLAEAELGKKHFSAAQSHTERAQQLLLNVVSLDPYSAFQKRLPEELGRAEILSAESFYGQKAYASSLKFYERGFQRLLANSSPSLQGVLKPEYLAHYASRCAKKDLTGLCAAWAQRLYSLYSKESVESKALVQAWPTLVSSFSAPKAPSRFTQMYKAPDLDQAAIDAALTACIDESYKNCRDDMTQFLVLYPRSTHRHRAKFWIAYSNAQRGDHEAADKLYLELIKEAPLTYYAVFSAYEVKAKLETFFNSQPLKIASRSEFLTPIELTRLQRVERLLAAGAFEPAALDLKELRPRDALPSDFILYLATLNAEARNYQTAFAHLSDLIQRGEESVYNEGVLKIVFPQVFTEETARAASSAELDPFLFISLIKQESAFDSAIVSSSGAVGLSQLMPFTATEVEPSVSRTSLLNAQTNLNIGAKYLRTLLKRYDGNIAFSIAAYNAGPAAVDRWLKEPKAKKNLYAFLESIPYRETRDYVGSIIRNHFWYSTRIGAKPFALKLETYFSKSVATATSPAPGTQPNN